VKRGAGDRIGEGVNFRACLLIQEMSIMGHLLVKKYLFTLTKS